MTTNKTDHEIETMNYELVVAEFGAAETEFTVRDVLVVDGFDGEFNAHSNDLLKSRFYVFPVRVVEVDSKRVKVREIFKFYKSGNLFPAREEYWLDKTYFHKSAQTRLEEAEDLAGRV